MSSLERLLSVLDLYSEVEPIWTLEEITRETGYARSTAYRYVKELCEAGLMIPIGKGAHVLGPRFIEFDRLIRNTDPLLIAAQKVMPQLYQEFGVGLLLLSSLYGDKVLCIHQEPLTVSFEVSYTRGRPMPLFYGATAKIILANLPERRLTKLFLNHRLEISKAGLGGEWDQFRGHLKKIRDQGFCVSRGEVDEGVTGIGSAIFAERKSVIGSLTYVLMDANVTINEPLTSRLNAGCERISDKISAILQDHDNMLNGYSQVISLKKIKPDNVA